MAIKSENTGSPAWKKVINEKGETVASLDELFNGDWSLNSKKTGESLVKESFSNPTKAIAWLNKNREILDEV